MRNTISRLPRVSSPLCILCVFIFIQVLAGAEDQKAIASTNFNEQVKELERYLDRELEHSEEVRKSFWKRDSSSITAYEQSIAPYREKLKVMIGRSENSGSDIALNVEQLAAHKSLIAETATHKSFRTSFTSRNGLTVYGILLVPNQAFKNPAVVCIHGMGGSPEQVAGLIEPQDYTRSFGRRLAERGYVVFAPLMTNTGKLRERFDRKAIMIGSRIQWIEQQKIFSVIDLLQSLPEVDAGRIGVYGISWGGRTAMYQGALDQRVAATVISGHFNDLVPKMVTASPHYTAYIDTEEGYAFFENLAVQFSDVDVASLICPRPVFIEEGKRDTVVWYPMAEKAFAGLQTYYRELKVPDRAQLKLFDGEHIVYGDDAFLFLDTWLKGSR
ncbi:MAG: alpha/beta hydrolase [Acidobacteriota bacterium]|nr:alpha/beta hydrolase [Acidobacteriota bacterium]